MTISQSIVLADNAFATIASGLAVSDTSLTFTTGQGARFPVVAAGQVLSCCLLNANNVLEEIDITAHTAGSDSATIVRAMGATTAKAWNSGDRIEARASSDVLRRLQQDALTETAISTADSGATYSGTLSPAPLGYVTGIVYSLKLATSNSGIAPTIALNGLSAITVKLDGGSTLAPAQMPINGLYKFDGTNFILLNPRGFKQWVHYALGDQSTVITAGTTYTDRMPACYVLAVRAGLKNASTSGLPEFDIKPGGVSMLSTTITIDANEKTSTSAVTPAVISTPAIADDTEVTFTIVAGGTNATGPEISMLVVFT